MRMSRRRALRGVVVHVVRAEPKAEFERDIVGAFRAGKRRGTCLWCGRPTGERRSWHDECVIFHAAARGLTHSTLPRRGPHYNDPLLPAERKCSGCGAAGSEVDHALPLGAAHQMGHRWHARALLPDNLQWLCRRCHVKKTARDRRLITMLRTRQPGTARLGVDAHQLTLLPD